MEVSPTGARVVNLREARIPEPCLPRAQALAALIKRVLETTEENADAIRESLVEIGRDQVLSDHPDCNLDITFGFGVEPTDSGDHRVLYDDYTFDNFDCAACGNCALSSTPELHRVVVITDPSLGQDPSPPPII